MLQILIVPYSVAPAIYASPSKAIIAQYGHLSVDTFTNLTSHRLARRLDAWQNCPIDGERVFLSKLHINSSALVPRKFRLDRIRYWILSTWSLLCQT